MIFKQLTSYCLVFIIWFCPDRDHRKGVIKTEFDCEQSLIFLLDTVECEHGRAAKPLETRDD